MSDVHATEDAARDDAWLALLKAGDPGALDALAGQYGESLIRYAARFVGSADRARDVVQDVFLALWRDRASVTVTRDVAAYLFWRVRNHALHVADADRSARARDARWTAQHQLDIASDDPIASDHTDVRTTVWNALLDVPPRCREIFMLVWSEQRTYAEVATILGISVLTVRNQMSRAVKHLGVTLGPSLRDS